MNTHNDSNHKSTQKIADSELVQSLVELGTEWAVLGISFGTQALPRSAKSLELAAKTLNTLSRTLERKPETQPAPADEVHPSEIVADGVDVTDEPSGS